MDDHYTILGVSKTATPEEIKSAYRKLASKHHPDKGGDTATFQKIQTAYDTLGNTEKRAAYDAPQQNFRGARPATPEEFEEMFRHFGFGDVFGRGAKFSRNQTISLQTAITLEDAYSGKELVANIQLPSGHEQVVNVKIPAGIMDGTTLRLSQLGDDSIKEAPRGDVHLVVRIQPHPTFQRINDDLIIEHALSPFDAILGTDVTVSGITGAKLNVTVPPGTQHGTILGLRGQGMPDIRDPTKLGRLLLKINIVVPTNLTDEQKDLVRQLKN
jgi:curved DNA-binding protein